MSPPDDQRQQPRPAATAAAPRRRRRERRFPLAAEERRPLVDVVADLSATLRRSTAAAPAAALGSGSTGVCPASASAV